MILNRKHEMAALRLGESKWSERPVGRDVVDALRERSAAVPLVDPPRRIAYAIFSRAGFTQSLLRAKPPDVHLLDPVTMAAAVDQDEQGAPRKQQGRIPRTGARTNPLPETGPE